MPMRIVIGILGYFICVIPATPLYSGPLVGFQQSDSMADVAREQRARNRDFRQPARRFTNDNLPTQEPGSVPLPFVALKIKNDNENSTLSSRSSRSEEPHDEKYFRKIMYELRAILEADKKALAALDHEMTEHMEDSPPHYPSTYAQYHPRLPWNTDPIGAANTWSSEDRRLRSSIESQEAKIAADEHAITDFVDQCRRESCEPGWIR